ncbi:MAG: DUF4163 domain-containing protein [Novosphingobium sp.]|nr:DUF4163 domain-containing protein [Novosphingobium sp.]
MRTTIPVGAALLTLGFLAASCSRQAEQSPAAAASSPAAGPSAAAAAPSPADTAAPDAPRGVKESNELIDFEYSYPDAAGAIPSLKAVLDAEMDKRKAELVANAKEIQAESKQEDFPYHRLASETLWQVVTDLPGWLSLSATIGEDQGGAHPNHGYDALLWDKQANQRRKVTDLFTSKAAFTRAIGKGFCAALDRQRKEKRQGEDGGGGIIDDFGKCIDPAGTTVILGSSNHQTFDRIGWLIGPYEAGSYAEGDYEITLPVTAAVIAAVKPEYRAVFSVRR